MKNPTVEEVSKALGAIANGVKKMTEKLPYWRSHNLPIVYEKRLITHENTPPMDRPKLVVYDERGNWNDPELNDKAKEMLKGVIMSPIKPKDSPKPL